jgi:hypothetical protein
MEEDDAREFIISECNNLGFPGLAQDVWESYLRLKEEGHGHQWALNDAFYEWDL